MKVKVYFLSLFKEMTGVKELTLELDEGERLKDLIDELNSKLGGRLTEALGLKRGELAQDVVVLVDGGPTRNLDLKLKNGCNVIFTVAIGGGGGLEVRCLNCLNRMEVKPGASEAVCLNCKIKYAITWLSPTQPRIKRVL